MGASEDYAQQPSAPPLSAASSAERAPPGYPSVSGAAQQYAPNQPQYPPAQAYSQSLPQGSQAGPAQQAAYPSAQPQTSYAPQAQPGPQGYPQPQPQQRGYGYGPQPGYGYGPQPGYGPPPPVYAQQTYSQQSYGTQPGYGYGPQPGYGYGPQPGYGYGPAPYPAAGYGQPPPVIINETNVYENNGFGGGYGYGGGFGGGYGYGGISPLEAGLLGGGAGLLGGIIIGEAL